MMYESDMEKLVSELLLTADEDHDVDMPENLRSVRTFEESGVMTYNKGLVVTFEDGSEFQLTIVKSGDAYEEHEPATVEDAVNDQIGRELGIPVIEIGGE